MNIETLRIFCDVVQHQSFSRGAKMNDVSQSAATQSVHRLEDYFGIPLVDRSKRPFVLTPEGQACFEGFREVLELYESVEARVRSLRMEIGGLVRVAAIYSVGLHDMSRCMQDFMRQYPNAKVRLEYLRPNKVYDAVLNAEADLGIVSYPAASNDLNVIPLRTESMVVVCPPRHSLTSYETVEAEQLEGMDFVGFDRDLSIRKEIDRHLRQRSVSIRVVMEFDNIETIKQAVQIGAGISILPEPTVRAEVHQWLFGVGAVGCAGAAAADRHYSPATQGVHAHHGQIRRPLATSAKPPAGETPMRDPEVLVCFRPSGREAYVLSGTRLVEAAAEAGLVAEVPCGGEGLCGKCRMIVTAGAQPPTDVERRWLSEAELAAGWRLACQMAVCEPTEVEIPPAARAAEYQILVHGVPQAEKGSGVFVEDAPEAAARKTSLTPLLGDPPVRKCVFALRPPTRGDDLPDVLRLERALRMGPLEIDLPLLREIPARLRQNDFRGTAVLANHRLLDVEPGDTEADAFAVAVDVGTTTLVAVLLDLATGSERAVDARLNPQTRFGDDVLSRILHARQGPDQLRQLHETITQAVDEMIGQLCHQAGIPRQRVYEAAFAGNTTMQQLLCGVDTSPLGEVPFAAATGRALGFPAAELGLHIHPRGSGYVMPVIGGFVGGDTVAGILATGLADFSDPSLLVDIGTNGEIVLQAGGRLWAASTAAGPAFEGARISCGMRGSTGAIEKMVVDGRLRINVIGNVAPTGLCGSGLIDVAAELLRHRLLTPQGRLQTRDQLPADVPADLARRIIVHEGRVAFLLASETETGDQRPLVLTQRDLRELQLAAGAIRAGVILLLRHAGLHPADLQRVLIGGGFGNFIRRSNAQRIGLLPREIEHRRIRYMGNTSLAGARLTALSRRGRRLAEDLARRTEHVDLSTDPAFQDAFADAMIFPEA